jgi:hypothetical protein
MAKICKISWLSEPALEAQVTVSDGQFEVICFSQPCNWSINQTLVDPIHCFEMKNVVMDFLNQFKVEKLCEPFGYYLTVQLIDAKSSVATIGDILVQLEGGSLPGDIKEKDFISFYCQRLDLY